MVQLLYQIALVGKRDFHLAPDGRSGFEMALLRMTVFQPDSIDAPAKTETPATVQGSGAGRISRSPRSARESGRAAGREPSRTGGGAGVGVGGDSGKESDVDQSPPRGAEQPAPDSPGANVTPLHPAQERNAVDPDVMEPDVLSTVSAVHTSGDGTAAVGDGIDWARFASSPGLRGISRELVMNMVPGEPGGDTLELVLDATSRHLYSDERLKKIERQCNDFFRRELRLSVTISELDDKARETPAMQRLREKQERQAEAERKFGGDSAVRGLMERFDAEIVPDSISPPSD
jgi:DNA polymerase-3 subunit gamma/tau